MCVYIYIYIRSVGGGGPPGTINARADFLSKSSPGPSSQENASVGVCEKTMKECERKRLSSSYCMWHKQIRWMTHIVYLTLYFCFGFLISQGTITRWNTSAKVNKDRDSKKRCMCEWVCVCEHSYALGFIVSLNQIILFLQGRCFMQIAGRGASRGIAWCLCISEWHELTSNAPCENKILR